MTGSQPDHVIGQRGITAGRQNGFAFWLHDTDSVTFGQPQFIEQTFRQMHNRALCRPGLLQRTGTTDDHVRKIRRNIRNPDILFLR